MAQMETNDATEKDLPRAEKSEVSLTSIAGKNDISLLSHTSEVTSALDYLPIVKFEETDKVTLTNLQDLLANFVPTLEGQEASTFSGVYTTLKDLRDEQARGEYGETTQRVFTQLLSSLEDNACPQVIRQLLTRQLTVEAGVPDFVTQDIPYAEQRHSNVPLDSHAVASPTLKADLHIDASQHPTSEEFDRIVVTLNWLSRQQQTLKQADLEILDNLLIKQIKKDNLGSAWLPHEDEDREQWRTAVTSLLDNIFKVRKYAEEVRIINEVQGAAVTRTDRAGNFEPLPYPPGVEGLNEDGTVDFRKDFPPFDPRIESSGQILRDLQAWSEKYGQQADLFASKIAVARANPQTLLAWTDLPLQDSEGVFVDGKFVNFVDEGMYEPRADETLAEINMLRQRFDVHTRENENGETEVVVRQSVQANDVPVYGYQNFDAEPIGAPYENEIIYKPDDFVPVQTPRGLSLIQAKDLESFQLQAMLGHYGGIGVMVIGDAGMLLTLGPEIKGIQLALKMGRPTLSAVYNAAGKIAVETIENELTGEGREAAASLTARQLYAQGAKTALRAAATVTAVFNNAGAMDTYWGETLNQLRGYYFLADMSFGIAGKAVLTPGAKFTEIMNQGNTAWLGIVHSVGDKMTKGTEPFMVGMAFSHLTERAEDLFFPEDKNLLDELNPVGQPTEITFEPSSNADLKSVGPEVLAFYEDVISRNAATDPEVAAIQSIFARTNELLADPANHVGRYEFVSDLLAPERFSSEEVYRLNQVMYENTTMGWEYPVLGAKELDQLWKGVMPTPGQLEEMYPDGNVPVFWNMLMSTPAVLAEAQQMRVEKEADTSLQVSIARRIAALVLSTDADGALPAVLNTEVRSPTAFYIDCGSRITALKDEDIQFANINLPVTSDELLRNLRSKMDTLRAGHRGTEDVSTVESTEPASTVVPTTSGEGIAIGDVLRRTGESYVYYAQVLQNILESESTSKEDQIAALVGTAHSGYGDILGSLIASNHSSETFGSTVDNLAYTLRRLSADQDKDVDVRATAGLLAYLSSQNTDTFKLVWPRVKEIWNKNPDMPEGTFAALVSNNLSKIATSESSTDEQLQDAARVLILLGGEGNQIIAARALQNAGNRASTVESYDTTITLLVNPGQDEQIPSFENILAPIDVLEQMLPTEAQQLIGQELDKLCKILALATSADANVKGDIPSLIETALFMVAEGTPEQSQQLSNALRAIIGVTAYSSKNQDIQNTLAALKAINQLEGTESMELLEKIARESIESISINPTVGVLALSLLDIMCQFDGNRRSRYIQLLRESGKNKISDTVLQSALIDQKTKYGLLSFPEETARGDYTVPSGMGDWMKDNVPALQASYDQNALSKAEDLGFFFTLFHNEEEEREQIRATMQETESIRATQFEMLAASAIPQQDADIQYSQQAKRALFSILMQPHQVIVEIGERIDGTDPRAIALEWQIKAAQALVAASEPGLRDQSSAKEMIRQALLSGDLPTAVEQILVQGWRTNMKPLEAHMQEGQIGLNSSYTEYVSVLDSVLADATNDVSFRVPPAELARLIQIVQLARQEVTVDN